jgi:hypothetical protein
MTTMLSTSVVAMLFLCGSTVAQDTETRLAVRANSFTRSTQDAVTLASNPSGATVLAWQSRRQQEGMYGVYARSFGPDGAVLSGEVQLNATTESHQTHPVVALDDTGCAWFAWRSFGQDGSLGAIVARRFDPTLTSATAEVIVNDIAAGDQRSPVIVALPDGGALVAWLDPGEGTTPSVRARRLTADGSLDGDAFDVSAVSAEHRTPTAAVDDAGRVTLAYARVDQAGTPAGVFLRTLEEGQLSEEVRIDVAGGVQAIEPALAATDTGLLVGWLESEGDGYGLRVRAITSGIPGPVRELATGEGWISGLALALNDQGDALATWNRHADGVKREAGLHARRLDASSARPAGETFRVTAHTEGSQAIAVATGGTKCALFPDGRMAFAWQGDAGGTDTSAVHLTLIAPAGVQLAAAAPVEDAPRFGDPTEGAARPTHDPPTFDPRTIERDRSEDQQGPAGGGIFDFLGFTSTGWVPPDPEMGVGPDHIVVMVNGGIAWFLKDGTQQFQQDINGSGGFWGSVGASGFVYDPEVVYDIHSQRFYVFASDGNAGFLLAVSDDSDPNGSWNKYKINTSGMFGTANVDSGNLAVDENFITITGDIFSPDRLAMLFIDKASAMSGGSLTTTDTIISGRQSMGTCTNQDAGSDTLYLTWANEFTSSTSIRIYAVTNRDTTPTVQFTTLTVPEYSHPNDPPQAGTSVRPELFEARFWSSMIVGGRLWAVHHEGSPRTRVQWYEIDLGNWPTSGTPTLVQSSQFNFGAGIFTFFPSIWADAAGNAAITFNQSSSSDFISVRMVTRSASDPLGKMNAPVLMIDGTAPDTSGRFGDYSATNSDPAMPGAFWGHHEYRTSNWRTRIGRIDTCVGSVTNYCTTSANSAGPGAVMSTTGSTSIAANDLVLHATAAPPNQFGLFFFGDQQQSTPLGDGTLCVAGSLNRFPVVTVDAGGTATFAPDLTNLPNGVTLSPGASQNMQFWFRDPPFGTAGYNLSDAIEIVFCN